MKKTKQKCRHWMVVSIILLTLMVFMASPSYSADLSAEQSGKIATVEHILRNVQNSIWQKLDSQKVNVLLLQLQVAEKKGEDSVAGQLRQQLEQIEKRLLGNAPPADAELVRLTQEKKMLLDELARLGGGMHASAHAARVAAIGGIGNGSISGIVTDSDGPVQDASVQVYIVGYDELSMFSSDTTDAEGKYTVSGLGAGDYQVSFSAADHAQEWYDDAPQQACAIPVTLAADDSAVTDINALLASTVTAETGSISGTVKGYDGNPVANAYVYVARVQSYAYPLRAAYTGADGKYTISGLQSGSYKVSFNAPDGSDLVGEWYNNKADYNSADAIVVTAPDFKTGIDATLEKSGSISGKVTDANSAGIADVNIYVYSVNSQYFIYSGYWTDSTDSNGLYEVTGLRPGSYKVKFDLSSNSFPGISQLASKWYNDKADSKSANSVNVTTGKTTANINAVLGVGGSISGKVIDDSGAGIGGVSVEIYNNDHDLLISADTSSGFGEEEGVYTVSGLPTGSYKVKFTPTGFMGENSEWAGEWYNDKTNFDNATEIKVTAPNTTANINAALSKRGSISGKVTDATSGTGLANIEVNVYDGNNNFVALSSTGGGDIFGGELGVYTISSLPPGSYKMYFYPRYSNSNFLSKEIDEIVVTAGQTMTVNAALSQGGSISGNVTLNGTALKCTDVVAVNASHSYSGRATTDYQGAYTISGLSAGSYKVYSYDQDGRTGQWHEGKSGFSCADPLAISEAQTTTVDFAFPAELQQCGGSAALKPIINLLLN